MFAHARITSLPNPLVIWGLAFIYAVILGLTLQKLILPLVPSLHAEHGLLQKDAIYFHTVAVQLAERIRSIGWSEWKLFSATGATGNVGLLAALYALLGPNPAWFIPFAAAAHATGATIIYLLGPLLWQDALVDGADWWRPRCLLSFRRHCFRMDRTTRMPFRSRAH